MDYEKKYNEALKRAEDFKNGIVHYELNQGESIVNWIFPELAESENERIRKGLIKMISNIDGGHPFENYGIIKKEAIAYLEKLKEQKPLEYLNKDMVYAIMNKLHDLSFSQLIPIDSDEFKKIDEITGDVHKLLDYPIKQKPAEWSEEDEEMLDAMVDIVANSLYEPLCPRDKMLDWLKSLRPSWKPSEQEKGALRTAIYVLTEEKCFHSIAQLKNILNAFEGKEPRKDWKPSEEQMDALADATMRDTFSTVNKALLESLYEQLKKL